jgi:hypothetical protein
MALPDQSTVLHFDPSFYGLPAMHFMPGNTVVLPKIAFTILPSINDVTLNFAYDSTVLFNSTLYEELLKVPSQLNFWFMFWISYNFDHNFPEAAIKPKIQFNTEFADNIVGLMPTEHTELIKRNTGQAQQIKFFFTIPFYINTRTVKPESELFDLTLNFSSYITRDQFYWGWDLLACTLDDAPPAPPPKPVRRVITRDRVVLHHKA